MKNWIMALVLFCAITGNTQHKTHSYYVHVKGDTVPLSKRSFIAIESHPQLLYTRDSANKRKVILPDSVTYLWLQYKDNTGVGYTLIDIPMKKKRVCRHYVRVLYSQGRAALQETPFCSECSSMEVYLTVDGKYEAIMNRDNYRDIIDTWFRDSPELTQIARYRKYRQNKMVGMLYRLRKNAAKQP